MESVFRITQLVLAIILIVIIIAQSSNAALGGAFGGSSEVVSHTRRGTERLLHRLTIALAVLFILVSVGSFLFSSPSS